MAPLTEADKALLDVLVNDYGYDESELAEEAGVGVDEVARRLEQWRTEGYLYIGWLRDTGSSVWRLTEDGRVLWRQKEGIVLRGRGTFDGVVDMAEAALRLREEAHRLEALDREGWWLDGVCVDDHCRLSPPPRKREAV
jgi:hypothetical protein